MVKKIKIRGRPLKSKPVWSSVPGKRRPWTRVEDEAIKGLVKENGTQQWAVIAEKLNKSLNTQGRSGKQCRERWHNHLDPLILKDPWTLSEEKILFEKHIELGNKWADISNYITGRTDNSIKNHFYSLLRKQYKKLNGFEATRDQLKEYDEILSNSILNSVYKKLKNKKTPKMYHDLESLSSCSDYGLKPLEDLIITGVSLDLVDHNYGYSDEIFMLPFDII
jgi:Myb-like DNA-binding domain